MLHKMIIFMMCMVIVALCVSCKKDSISIKEAISSSESITKTATANDAVKFAQKRTKGEGAKGLLENAISGTPEELAFAIGTNIAEIDIYYLTIKDPISDQFLNNALNFFYTAFQKKTLYDGDKEDYKTTIEGLKRVYKQQQFTLQDVKAVIEPFLAKVKDAMIKKYGKDGDVNQGMGYHTLMLVFATKIPESKLNNANIQNIYKYMQDYLASKGKSNGKSYNACNDILKEVQSQITNKVVVGTNADIILANYMN